jgi:hypothetical protein
MDERSTAEYKNKSYFELKHTHDNEERPWCEKLRVIAFNTQGCYNMNFFLMGERDDPMHQMQWLEDVLRDTEAKNQTAILMGHVPPGGKGCTSAFSGRFRALMDRF